MNLPVMPPVAPMLAELGAGLPVGEYQYEPKWDGFRAIVFRDGDQLELMSRHQRPLARYFPELVTSLKAMLPPQIVVDGEIVIVGDRGLDFDALLLRLHPSATRVTKLAAETPASFVAFDLLALGERDLRPLPLARRRVELERALVRRDPTLVVTPATTEVGVARDWFLRFEGAGLDGVIAKPLDLGYVEDERVMIKVKHRRTADCVVGGFRRGKDGHGVASLLLGLYDPAQRLVFVGVASGFPREQRQELEAALAPLAADAITSHPWLGDDAEAGGEVRIPGGPSRWTGTKDMSWHAVRPDRVAEVSYDHMQGDRFRHATRFLRWRPDRVPASCTFAQLERAAPSEIADLLGARRDKPRREAAGHRRRPA